LERDKLIDKEGVPPVDSKPRSPFSAILFTSLFLLLVGGVGLALLFDLTVPTLGPRWLLFFLVTLAVSGLALPVAYFINIRFPSTPPANAGVLLREALFFGIYVDLVIWLQFGKVLNFAIAVFILAGFVLIEFLLRWRERNRFSAAADEE
jgi:hypothetical protein